MGNATYRIGPSDFFTPDDLASDARTLNGQVNSLDNANWDNAPGDLLDAWDSFLAEWRGFYTSSFGGFFTNLATALNDANRDQLIQYEIRFATFAEQYQAATSKALPGGVVQASTGAKDNIGSHILNQLQPLIPSIDALYIVGGLAIAAALLYIFRAPLSRAVSKVAA
jgi:hypothetical protein